MCTKFTTAKGDKLPAVSLSSAGPDPGDLRAVAADGKEPMRQTLKDRRKQLHRGMPMPRLLTMVLMLAIMALIFVRLRDPNTWRWFARDNDDDNPVVAENEKAADAGRTSGCLLRRKA